MPGSERSRRSASAGVQAGPPPAGSPPRAAPMIVRARTASTPGPVPLPGRDRAPRSRGGGDHAHPGRAGPGRRLAVPAQQEPPGPPAPPGRRPSAPGRPGTSASMTRPVRPTRKPRIAAGRGSRSTGCARLNAGRVVVGAEQLGQRRPAASAAPGPQAWPVDRRRRGRSDPQRAGPVRGQRGAPDRAVRRRGAGRDRRAPRRCGRQRQPRGRPGGTEPVAAQLTRSAVTAGHAVTRLRRRWRSGPAVGASWMPGHSRRPRAQLVARADASRRRRSRRRRARRRRTIRAPRPSDASRATRAPAPTTAPSNSTLPSTVAPGLDRRRRRRPTVPPETVASGATDGAGQHQRLARRPGQARARPAGRAPGRTSPARTPRACRRRASRRRST